MSDIKIVEHIIMYIESQILKEVENKKNLNMFILNDALHGLELVPDTIANVLNDVLSYNDSLVRIEAYEDIK